MNSDLLAKVALQLRLMSDGGRSSCLPAAHLRMGPRSEAESGPVRHHHVNPFQVAVLVALGRQPSIRLSPHKATRVKWTSALHLHGGPMDTRAARQVPEEGR